MFRCLTFAVGLALAALPGRAAFGCKYSVRDVGFVDLDTVRYRLVLCSDRNSPAEHVDALRETAESLLRGANIIVETAKQEDSPVHSAIEFLRAGKRNPLPAAVLVAPDGRKLAVPLAGPEDDPKSGRSDAALQRVATSPMRDRILELALSAHSVVLLAEGTNADNNRRARALAEESIETVRRSLDSLPKPVGGPPELVVVAADRTSDEAVLLWSLGIERGDPAIAHLVVLFGRGRLVGAAMAVPGGTSTELTERLRYIGRDCECELDRTWMQGAMIPHRWDLSLQEESTKRLGFDPDSPLVKYDMRRILARGSASGRQFREIGNDSGRDPLLGYTEMPLPEGTDSAAVNSADDEHASPANAAQSPTVTITATTPPTLPIPDDRTAAVSQANSGPWLSPLRAAWIAVGTLGLIAFAGGGLLLVRSRRP